MDSVYADHEELCVVDACFQSSAAPAKLGAVAAAAAAEEEDALRS